MLAVATLVHLIVASIGLAGALSVWKWPGPIGTVVGIVLLVFTLWLSPFWPRRPARREWLSSNDLPRLALLIDGIARDANTRSIDRFLIDERYNAAVTAHRRSRTLILGLPLFATLDGDTFRALLGHELGHFVSGDILRGWYAGSAQNAVAKLYDTLIPLKSSTDGLGELLSRLVLWVLRQPVYGLAWLLALVSWRQSQLAEYRADSLAVRLAGASATARLLRSLPLDDSVGMAMRRAASADPDTIWDQLREHVRTLPHTEFERALRQSILSSRLLDSTHPPMSYRIQIIEHVGRLAEVGPSARNAAEFEAARYELLQRSDPILEVLNLKKQQVRPRREAPRRH